MSEAKVRYAPEMSDAGLRPSHEVVAIDEYGNPREGFVAGERALALVVDDREVVTLMTLGSHPELLTLGYLLGQRLVPCLEAVDSVRVDWDAGMVRVETFERIGDLEEKMRHRTVTSGCGQGTVFGRMADQIEAIRLTPRTVAQSEIYALLGHLTQYNEVYKQAGAVHGCALCEVGAGVDPRIHLFVEDVGRHNAADAISGYMWLNDVDGSDKWFYTTGRLTSEMVIKVAQMGISVLVSRSGVTYKGLELARTVGVTMIARAKGRHFLVYHGADRVVFDAIPTSRPGADTKKGAAGKG